MVQNNLDDASKIVAYYEHSTPQARRRRHHKIHHESKTINTNKSNLSEASDINDRLHRKTSAPFPVATEDLDSSRSTTAHAPSEANHKGTARPYSPIYEARNGGNGTYRFQDGIACGGSFAPYAQRLQNCLSTLYNPVLGPQDKDNEIAAFPPRHYGCYRGGVHEPFIPLSTEAQPTFPYHNPYVTPHYPFPSAPFGQGIHLPFSQTGCRTPFDGACGVRPDFFGGSHATRKSSAASFAPTVFWGEREHCQSIGDPKSNETSLKPSIDLGMTWDTLDGDTKFSNRRVWSRPHRPLQPPTHEQMSLPLHAPAIRSIDLEKIRKWMTTETKNRFDEVWALLTSPMRKRAYELTPISKTTISEKDISHLLKSEIIHRVAYEEFERRPTRACVIPFTTYEEREEGPRRRFICWPKHQNQALNNKYIAHVPIGQPASYVNKIIHGTAMKRDLKAGFFQVELPVRRVVIIVFAADQLLMK